MKTDNNTKCADVDNDISIKTDIVTIMKEVLRFALLVTIIFVTVGMSLLYAFKKFTNVDMNNAALLTGIIVAILIVFIDEKKIRANDKIIKCNRRIVMKILK